MASKQGVIFIARLTSDVRKKLFLSDYLKKLKTQNLHVDAILFLLFTCPHETFFPVHSHETIVTMH